MLTLDPKLKAKVSSNLDLSQKASWT